MSDTFMVNGKTFTRTGEKPREVQKGQDRGSDQRKETQKSYSQPDPMNVSLQGRSMVITLVTGRTETGICRRMGQFFLELESQGKTILINKGSIVEVVL